MPPIRTATVQKKRVHRYGTNMAQINSGDRHYFIHEELLCASSPYFRKRLQGNRKAIEGECSTCFNKLSPTEDTITFCTSCGGNIHLDCMRKWEQERKTVRKAVTCPLCRAGWAWKDDKKIRTENCQDLSSIAVDIYTQWLYEDHITIEDNGNPEPDEKGTIRPRYSDFIDAYTFAIQIGDAKFRKAIAMAAIEVTFDSDCFLSWDELEDLYYTVDQNYALRNFWVEYCARKGKRKWFDAGDDDEAHYPATFLGELVFWFMKSRDDKDQEQVAFTVKSMKKKYAAEEDAHDAGNPS